MDSRRMKSHYFFYYSIILFIAFLIRIPYLGVIPPGGANSFIVRIPTAITSIVTISLFILIVKLSSKNNLLSLISGITMTLLPWHIEQSRVYSPAMLGLTIILFGITALKITHNKFLRLMTSLLTLIIFSIVFPEFWLFLTNFNRLKIDLLLGNLFKLISVEFLFYKNDSFWFGGFRTQGVMLPSMLPLFSIGVFKLIKKMHIFQFKIILAVMIIWLVSALAPKFPEQQIYFLICPILCYIIALGVIYILEQINTTNILKKSMMIIYFIFIIYEYGLFFHTYTWHYPNRIKSEITTAQINF
jgi:hypothetical protein